MIHTKIWLAALLIVALGPASSWAAEEERSVLERLEQAAKATASFSDTRDRDAVLRSYTADYVGVQDGTTETKEAIEQWLSDYERELDLGSSLRFISSLSNLTVGVSGPLAWAVYDYVFQAVRRGQLEGRDAGKCTALLRKEGGDWLIFHEHCSKGRSPS